jgi:hypothetical protein
MWKGDGNKDELLIFSSSENKKLLLFYFILNVYFVLKGTLVITRIYPTPSPTSSSQCAATEKILKMFCQCVENIENTVRN